MSARTNARCHSKCCTIKISEFLFLKGNEPPEVSYKDKAGKYMGQQGVTLPKL